jgi:hypothetical protein
MSLSNQFETALLNLLFKNQALANVGDASGLQPSGAAGSLYVSLHTGDPGEGGDQTTSEATYGSYARVAVVRSGSGWIVSGNQVTNAADITFPACTSGSSSCTYMGIGTDSSGAGVLILRGALTPTLPIATGITPRIVAGGFTATID